MAVVHGEAGSEVPDDEKLNSAFVIGPERTSQQDVEFAVSQLVEIAAKALSPGINDPYTAINAIERLGGAFANIISKTLPSGLWHDEEGALRLAIPVPDAHGLPDAAYLPLRAECAWRGSGGDPLARQLISASPAFVRIRISPQRCANMANCSRRTSSET